MSRLNGPPISPGLKICEPPAIRPRRSLSLGFWRADRYPRFCPRSRGPRRCLTRLMSSKPLESRSVPLSVREAAGLETTLRSIMESYNFQLWTMTALFRLLGESGHFNLDDPLLDQFQRSFSRGTENVAAGMASAVAFVTTKRRESFLSHMVASVTDAQKRKLLSDPLFHQKDLCACHHRGGKGCLLI